MPANTSGHYTEYGEYLPTCLYECNDGSSMQNNPKCLSQLDLFFDNIGGLPVFIILSIGTVFAIISVAYFFYSRNSKESANFENDENLYRLRLAVEELDFV
jgi:hypothetical protein